MEREKVLVGLDGKGELMLLKNKKTGEIIDGGFVLTYYDGIAGNPQHSLAELNEEWEDVPEEPKVFWYIDDFMIMCGTKGEFTTPDLGSFTKKDIEKLKEIGNYFDSREEAEKAVEKLKAFKRLKDKGFRFTLTPGVGSLDITPGKFQIEINADMPKKWFCCDAVQKDLEVCFGGEE